MSDYTYWEKALADPAALHNREFRITTDPMPGFYRTRRLNEPVAIWADELEDGGLIVMVNGVAIHRNDYETVWLNSAKHPVTEAAYHHAVETGRWDDLDETVAALKDDRRNDPASIIDDLAGQAAKYQEITEDDEARRAISLRAALQEQGKKVDKVREAEKAPHLRAAREVDEIYMTTVKLAKTWADYLRHLVEAFETRKRRMIKQAEDDRLAAIALDIMKDLSPEALPEPADQIRTGYGRAASVRTKMVVTGIKDWGEALRWYTGDERLLKALMEIAQRDTDGGNQPAGFAVEEQAIVR